MFNETIKLIKSGVGTAYPGAAVAIGCKHKVFEKHIFGKRQIKPQSLDLTNDTLFDIASLSKLVSTTFVALKFIEEGKLSLQDNISKFLDYTGNYSDCKIKHLLTHTSGIPAWMPLFSMKIDKENALKTILDSERQSKTGEKVDYSCMGYIVLQKILENIGGAPLDILAQNYVFSPLKMNNTCYNPDKNKPIAATEWGSGSVHDENADFLGGVSGNAGVFTTLDDLILFAEMCSSNGITNSKEIYLKKETLQLAVKNHTPEHEESRGLGFKLIDNYYGHTGFTGTSLFIDKETGLWGILLTNAVHFGRENKKEYLTLRKKIYDIMIKEFNEEK
ncbi:MAG: beta-lactamase family protein [Clostridia bacterium]|nr:beta-lactamase family protein [Clostridia bacterium]